MKKKLLILSTFFMIFSAFSQVDQFNTYIWKGQAQKKWYEWWYYKVVIPETNESFYFVYGVVNPGDVEHKFTGTRAHVGAGDFNTKLIIDKHLPVSNFEASKVDTFVRIDGNTATDRHVEGNLENAKGETMSWDFSINKEWGFNAMGWAMDDQITNIFWYPVQASAKCSGQVISNGKLHQFINAPCYQDRNWGVSFPKWWAWVVSNKFEQHPETVLAVGGGRPKYFGTNFKFEGVSIGLKHKGHEYAFRPNDLNLVKININYGTWEMSALNKTHKIEISAKAPKSKFMDLQFMTPDGYMFHDYETLTGEVWVKLYKRNGLKFQLLDTLYSKYAGIEYGSPVEYPQELFFTRKIE